MKRSAATAMAALALLGMSPAEAACARAGGAPSIGREDATKRAQQALEAKLGKKEADRFRPPELEFDAKARVWLAYFRQRGPYFLVDGDINVWIKDPAGESCVAVGIDVGECLTSMYPEKDAGPADHTCRTESSTP